MCFISPLTEEVLCIFTPRNLALLFPELVIRVFSSDSSKLSSAFRKSLITDFSSTAFDLGPTTPISQSSAYLT